MALTTYDELKTAVASWLNRSDLTTLVPDFITLGEAELRRALEVPDTETSTTLTTTGGTDTVALPSDLGRLSKISITVGGTPYELPYMTPQNLVGAYAGYPSGQPRAYTIVGTNMKFGPTPDGTYSIPIDYFAKLVSLSDSAPSNWLLASHPDVYLYASLVASAPKLGNDIRLGTWTSLANAGIESINQQATERTSGASMASRVDGPTP